MKEFYRRIAELSIQSQYIILLGLNGENCGHRGILKEEELLYETTSGSFDEDTIKSILVSKKPGIIQTNKGELFLEYLSSPKRIVICGGGHVSLSVIPIAKMMQLHTAVIEDRPLFADMARKKGADEVICDNFSNALKHLDINYDTFVILLTRGHRHDGDCLRAVLGRSYGYLGMIGSRARVKRMKEELILEGFLQDELLRMHSPIGLPIGANTPEEIAVSIMAEVIQVKNSQEKTGGFEKEIADFLFQYQMWNGPFVLATIVERKGSAPRDVGTKMIVFVDGKTIGTIGGGCVEADVTARARHMLRDLRHNEELRCVVMSADLTGEEAEELGMVCGGILRISLEIIL